MQINNSRALSYYSVVPAEGRSNARLPVVFGATVEFKPAISSQRADNTSVVLAAEQHQASQQARFVRDFITAERQLDPQSVPQQVLPRAVQQYLTVADINSQNLSAQRLLDEIV
ncbi:hypothetical protein [Methylophaga sp. OBS4]|uniref:hypothetical protein n=1 Tax=Methylophaga sp. OBS4 TaxID=2991935 RepID=UPI0022561E41|nr:hypothetical protein [Methylophaga sp. OBS4]MCX4188234.1 hypothetical protein [Methylophaga sp. OBS4]